MTYSINNMAARIVEEEILPNADALNVSVHRLENGATVIDMGIDAKGGWMAGKLFTDTCLGGLGVLEYRSMYVGKHLVPVTAIHIDQPHVTQLSSHIAGLFLPYRGHMQPVSGPLRSIRRTDTWSKQADYQDTEAEKAVGHVQITTLPDEELTDAIAGAVGMEPKDLYLMASRTSTIVGAIQITARNLEQIIATVSDYPSFPIDCIRQGIAWSPVISIVDDEVIAMGRVNDGLIYGQEGTLYVDCEDEVITGILPQVTMSRNEIEFGIPFEDMFREADCDWGNVPREQDAPAKINFVNMRTGNTFHAGMIHYGVLERDFIGY